jgi:hypothetical protein
MAAARPVEKARTAALKTPREIRTSHPIKTWKSSENARFILVSRVREEINILIARPIFSRA